MRTQQKLGLALAAWLSIVIPASAQSMQDAIKAIPEKTVAFVIVKNIGELNNKIETLAKRIGAPLPGAPLDLAKASLGIGDGVDTKGSLLLAVVIPKEEQGSPLFLVYVPVTDYATFLKGLNAKTDGDVATVDLANGAKQAIVVKQGSFAIFTDPSSKAALQETLMLAKPAGTAFAAIQAQLTHNDVSAVLTPRGVKLAAIKSREALLFLDNPALFPPEVQASLSWLKGMDGFLKSVESDVSHIVLGTALDKTGNMDVNVVALFTPGSEFAKSGAKNNMVQGDPLAGLPNIPFFMTFSGSTSGGFMSEMMKFGMKTMTAMAKDVPPEKLQKLEQAGTNMLKNLQSMSMVLGSGSGKETLFQNAYATMKVVDSAAYLQNYDAYLDAYDSLMKDAKLPEGFPKQNMTSKKTEVDGLSAREVTADLSNIAANQPELVNKMLEIYFGTGGKMTVTSVAVDKNTVLVRYTPAAEVKDFIKTFKTRSGGLAENKDIIQTAKLLPEGSQWIFYISPRGSMAFAQRMIAAMAPPPQADAMRLPEFPQSPPVGVAVKLSATGLEKRLVIPAAVFDAIGTFHQQMSARPAAGLTP